MECAIDKKRCTYSGCSRKGKWPDHPSMDQLPGCCFPKDAERTYDRSVRVVV